MNFRKSSQTKKNLDMITIHNNEKMNYKLAPNKFIDFDLNAFKAKYTGYNKPR